MAKFVNSSESISSSLLLWNDRPTQVSIEETYDLKVWPVTNLFNDGPINFTLPPQPKGLLTDLHIVTKLKLQKDGEDFSIPQKNVSIINNLANSLWGEVSVICSDRTELCQSMKNAYAYQTFFNTALNSEKNREDFLLYNEAFLMDEGVSKKSEEDLRLFWKWDESHKNAVLDNMVFEESEDNGEGEKEKKKEAYWSASSLPKALLVEAQRAVLANSGLSGDNLELALEDFISNTVNNWIPTDVNPAASKRSALVNRGQSLTLNSKFQCPLLNTLKCLPTNMKLRLSLTKNKDEFLLLCGDDSHSYSIVLEDCYILATYYRVRDEIHSLIEERLQKEPIPYFISRPEIIIRPVTQSSKIIRMSDVFSDTLPPYAFFTLQRSRDFDGRSNTNPFIFHGFKKFQFYRNGVPYFNDPLEVGTIDKLGDHNYVYSDFGEYFRQLYRTIGKDSKGNCLIDSTNFHLNFMVGMSFGADRSSLTERHLNLQEKASTYLEIDLGIEEIPEDLILIVYAVFDRQLQIDADRMVRIID